jgi:RHS repeat-associated protein
MNSDGISNTNHLRRIGLSQYAGKAISSISLLADGNTTPGSSWQILYKDIALVSTDGTVRPIYTNQNTVSLNIWGTSGSSRSYQIDTWGGAGPYVENAHFYSGDHLGSARLLTAWGGAPVWSGTFLPYGVEWNPTATTNNYKFTDQEHDAETGDSLTALDHFWFRQYRGGLGRWMSPDPAGLAAVDLSNPQSLNRYAYVNNDPINWFDPFGLVRCTLDGAPINCNRIAPLLANGFIELGPGPGVWGLILSGPHEGCWINSTEAIYCAPDTYPFYTLEQPGWWGTFATEFVKFSGGPGNVPTCAGQAIREIANDVFNPFPTEQALTPADAGKFVAAYGASVQVKRAANYAAARGLTYPMRSSVFREMLQGSRSLAEEGGVGSVAVATSASALYRTYTTSVAARNGNCATALPVLNIPD